MSRANSLTAEARAGYDGNDNPYLYSSPCWYAHRLGRYLHDTGRAPPADVRMGRGSIVHNGDTSYRYDDATGWSRIK